MFALGTVVCLSTFSHTMHHNNGRTFFTNYLFIEFNWTKATFYDIVFIKNSTSVPKWSSCNATCSMLLDLISFHAKRPVYGGVAGGEVLMEVRW